MQRTDSGKDRYGFMGLIIEHIYRGVRAFLYTDRKNYRILYIRDKDNKYIGDMPIKGITSPWSKKDIEHSIDVLFEDMRKGR